MRHIRARRRLKFMLGVLFAAALILFFEEKLESFAPQLKRIVEARAEEAFSNRFTLSIGSLEGGVLRPITLHDVRIHDKKLSSIISSLEIKSAKLDRRVWDAFFKKSRGRSLFGLLSTEPSVSLNFITKNNELSGFMNLRGDIENADVSGSLLLFEEKKVNFKGRIKGRIFEIELKLQESPVEIEGEFLDDGYLKTDIKIEHLKIHGVDIVCRLLLKNRFVSDKLYPHRDYLEGELETKNFIVNQTPFLDLKASYRIQNGVVEICDLEIGDEFKVRGRISLKHPYNINLTLVSNNANLMKLWSYCGLRQNAVITGTMNGKFELKGPLDKMRTIARMNIRRGRLGNLDFDSIDATLIGDGPIIRIEDSTIARESGYFSLAGNLDFRKFGTSSAFQNIKITTDDRAIIWDGWNADKIHGAKEIRMEKRMSEEVTFGFKKFILDEKVDESLRDKDEVEVEYRVHPRESLKMMFGSDSGNFFGLEHKDKF